MKLSKATTNHVWDACAAMIARTPTLADGMQIAVMRDAITLGDKARAESIAKALHGEPEMAIVNRAIARL